MTGRHQTRRPGSPRPEQPASRRQPGRDGAVGREIRFKRLYNKFVSDGMELVKPGDQDGADEEDLEEGSANEVNGHNRFQFTYGHQNFMRNVWDDSAARAYAG